MSTKSTLKIELRMFSIKARQEAMVAQMNGMIAENMFRQSIGESIAYNDTAFDQLANNMVECSDEFERMIEELI